MLAVDHSDPPPWVVHVSFMEGGQTIPATWPFSTEREARMAYTMAVKSGQFTKVLKPATRARPAFEVTLASLWRLEPRADLQGNPMVSYLQIEPPKERTSMSAQQTQAEAPAPVAITRRKVISSNLAEVGYDEASRTLAVQFRSGAVYHYAEVLPDTYGALLASSSPGGYLASHIKPRHTCTRQPAEGDR